MPSSGPLGRALALALRDARLPDSDSAGAALAAVYAEVLDDARAERDVKTLALVGPKYTALLTALGLTAAGRGGAAPAGKEPPRVHDPAVPVLDDIRSRRRGAG
jgi:hypothetical protein